MRVPVGPKSRIVGHTSFAAPDFLNIPAKAKIAEAFSAVNGVFRISCLTHRVVMPSLRCVQSMPRIRQTREVIHDHETFLSFSLFICLRSRTGDWSGRISTLECLISG